MNLLVLGLNHKTATVALRERVAISPEQMGEALTALKKLPGVDEAVILSTCNRTELYCSVEAINSSVLSHWLAEYRNLDPEELARASYLYQDSQALLHLLRVVSSLDSLIVGEPQILGQVKNAYQKALEHKSARGMLSRLFQHSFSVAKKVRTETQIGANAVSTAYAAVALARQIFGSLSGSQVLLVGAGEIIELVARHIKEQGCGQITVANRTRQRAQELALGLQARVASLTELPDLLPEMDIVISSTASPLPLIGKGMVEQALKVRRYRPILLIDLAVPRDIEAAVDELADAYLYSIDDLNDIIEDNRESRRQAAEQAEWIVEQEQDRLYLWYRSLAAVSLVREYRRHTKQLAQQQLERALQGLAAGDDPEQVLRELTHRLTNKISHGPTQLLHQAGREHDQALLLLMAQQLGLNP